VVRRLVVLRSPEGVPESRTHLARDPKLVYDTLDDRPASVHAERCEIAVADEAHVSAFQRMLDADCLPSTAPAGRDRIAVVELCPERLVIGGGTICPVTRASVA
jgi:hypothetical protein